jgi:hypothetical protein
MTALELKKLICETQARFSEIDHADWDGNRYSRTTTDKWIQAACEVVPEQLADWREMVRVLAQGESYYGGEY